MEKKDIISLEPTQSQLDRALAKVHRVREENNGSNVMNEYSKMGGNRTVGAFLLEEVLYDKCIEADLDVEDVAKAGNRHYDLKLGQYKIDAKAKYTTYHQVYPDFNAGIYEYEVTKEAKVVRKGEKDPFGDGRGCDTMDEDCRVIQIKSLSPFKKFKNSENYWEELM